MMTINFQETPRLQPGGKLEQRNHAGYASSLDASTGRVADDSMKTTHREHRRGAAHERHSTFVQSTQPSDTVRTDEKLMSSTQDARLFNLMRSSMYLDRELERRIAHKLPAAALSPPVKKKAVRKKVEPELIQ